MLINNADTSVQTARFAVNNYNDGQPARANGGWAGKSSLRRHARERTSAATTHHDACLHLGDKDGLALYLAVLGLQFLDERHAMALLLLALLLKVFAGYFELSLVALFGGPKRMLEVMMRYEII